MRKAYLSKGWLIAIALFGLAACQTTANSADRLTADQVRATFIGHEWKGSSGTFLFAEDGTWRYRDPRTDVHGTYQIADDGVVCATNALDSARAGLRTCYTFYRDGSGYRYWHDRSGRFWPAYVR